MMKSLIGMVVILLLSITGAFSVAGMREIEQSGQSTFTKADYPRWIEELSNWGRWGDSDEIGALNLVTPEKIKEAASLVKSGVSVSLAQMLGPNIMADGRRSPYQQTRRLPEGYEERMSTESWTAVPAEELTLPSHGNASHLDGMAHNIHNGMFYNGFSYKEVTPENGATKGSIANLRHGIVTRGVLMDIPRLKGVPYLQADERIYVEDLEAWEERAGFKVTPGDALFIRVGHWALLRAEPGETSRSCCPNAGLDPEVIPWLKERGVAVMGAESGAHDIQPSGYTGGPMQHDVRVPGDITDHPVHYFALIYLGIQMLDSLDLDALSEVAAQENRWEFQLVAAPLPINGGTGSPINPIAIF